MRVLLCTLLVCLLSATFASGEEIDTSWIQISTEQGSREINENDYGAIFLKVNSVNSSAEASKISKFFKGIAKAIGRYLSPDTKAFVFNCNICY